MGGEEQYGFIGYYETWEEANQHATGYDEPCILERAKEAIIAVKSGKAVFERDTLQYDEPHYSYPLISYLLNVALSQGNRLRLLDFGGSLGSIYFQCRPFLNGLRELSWNVVEQPHFVQAGQQLITEEGLKFYYDMEQCVAAEKPDAILLSGVLQVLEDPYAFLTHVLEQRFKYIVFDRTPFTDVDDFVSVQYVPPDVYDASYASWFFNYDKFWQFLDAEYECVDYFDSFESWNVEGVAAQNMGFLWKRKG